MSGPSFGVEEEFLLVDPLTGWPVACNAEVARHAARRGIGVQLELTASQVEVATDKADTSSQLREQISQLRAATAASAQEVGAVLLAAGMPPAGDTPVPITDSARYRRIADAVGMIADERGNCGCHVHVEVPSRDAAIAASNWLRPWLPVMLALTANSSIHRGSDTGHASWRNVVWARWPSAGPPPYFNTEADCDAAVAALLESGAIFDDGMIYWDVRPSVRFPTVEVRVADVALTAAETVLHATLVRASVMTALAAHERGESAPAIADHLVRLACWKAAHDGLGGRLLDITGLPNTAARAVPAMKVLQQWLTAIGPALAQLGDDAWVCPEIHRLLGRGNGAIRQRRAWRHRRDVADVVAELAAGTLS